MYKIHAFFVSLGLLGYLMYILIGVGLFIGWILNIFDLIGMRHADSFTVEICLRIVGVAFMPLGGVMGWL